MSFQPGTYFLVNVKHARDKIAQGLQGVGSEVSVMDLSGGDNESIIGFPLTDGDNQKWIFEPTGDGNYYIRNKQHGKYLTFPDDANDGKHIIATEGPRPWEVRVGHEGENVKDERESIRIFVPGTEQNLDLTNHGDTTPGTRVQLWEKTAGQGQAWYPIPTE